MKELKSERRLQKITKIVNSRQFTLRVVLENIHDPHNVSAIFRTCDAVGIPKVSLIYYLEKFPKIGKKSSASAFKWVEKEKFSSVSECFESLKKDGFTIYTSTISDDAIDLYKLNFKKKIAIVLGNEHRGVSNEAAKLADKKFKIPMFGMVQSLNVSVAAAIVLYEALRQRKKKSYYEKSELNKSDMEELIEKWSRK
ncbi:MAG: RNA methyltransferase [Ignavibacteria bacterium RIFOXYB2_FULL_35_12]|nr:MAG: RNA methyltransferase [Ignavibacteria bacterium GWA2_36_19]OGU49083.1 MAG: RNA methyltransferase [Ignavibacteria bacterium GWC2_35_8]OGU60992.1 MAG: RNA methyltransferase [Ignavibacteria bacterium GWF2_35_20]OGU83479.1 MAG: RNA methyltransferase [Ignavibacteria bacterium RIFOXYA2_FULL_35_9]OGU84950.1 MAG: RNA methyltransferase [Ignavibacteria bacterium RIFOXYA12_FULL_35_25]OGU92577.1 MAG: RNA methyltransferase [Ignavibacteria bacterium RIFOXYC12_FULL_35_11]OGU95747.1 MAG: RNA methyltr